MTDDITPQPFTPPVRQANRYGAFREFKREITAREAEVSETQNAQKEVFRATIIARAGEGAMNEEDFVYELIFKPSNPELRLRPEYMQLLLAYYEEMLKQIEGE